MATSARAPGSATSPRPSSPAITVAALRRVLLVEDEPTIGVTLSDDLAACGYDVTWLGDGTRAVDLLDAVAFPIVITDLRLPGADGVAVVRAARRARADARVLVISAAPGAFAAALAAAQPDACLVKPFGNERVLEWLQHGVVPGRLAPWMLP